MPPARLFRVLRNGRARFPGPGAVSRNRPRGRPGKSTPRVPRCAGSYDRAADRGAPVQLVAVEPLRIARQRLYIAVRILSAAHQHMLARSGFPFITPLEPRE